MSGQGKDGNRHVNTSPHWKPKTEVTEVKIRSWTDHIPTSMTICEEFKDTVMKEKSMLLLKKGP